MRAARESAEASEVAAYRELYRQLGDAAVPAIPERTLEACANIAQREQRSRRVAMIGACAAAFVALAVMIWALIPAMESIGSQAAAASAPWGFIASLGTGVIVSRIIARRLMNT